MRHIATQGIAVGLFTNGNASIPALFTAHTDSITGLNCSDNNELNGSSPATVPSQSACTTLSSLLSLSLNAGDVGAQKPSMVPFIAMSQLTNIPPYRILYVGDNFVHDVVAAKQANIHAAYLCRTPSMPSHHGHDVKPDIELTSLDPTEFDTKLQAYINTRNLLCS